MGVWYNICVTICVTFAPLFDFSAKGACGGTDGGVFEYDYPKGSLRAKMREADRTNPNVYSSIEELKGDAKNSEHLYEDIKVQKREADNGESLILGVL